MESLEAPRFPQIPKPNAALDPDVQDKLIAMEVTLLALLATHPDRPNLKDGLERWVMALMGMISVSSNDEAVRLKHVQAIQSQIAQWVAWTEPSD